MGLKSIFSYFLSYAANFKEYQACGFKARTFNNDFILIKNYPQVGLELRIYQGIEPYHPQIGELIDFEIPDACLVICGVLTPALTNALKLHFDHLEVRGDYAFAFTRHLELDDHKMKLAVVELDRLISVMAP